MERGWRLLAAAAAAARAGAPCNTSYSLEATTSVLRQQHRALSKIKPSKKFGVVKIAEQAVAKDVPDANTFRGRVLQARMERALQHAPPQDEKLSPLQEVLAGLRRELLIIWSSRSPLHIMFKVMQVGALAGIATFFIPNSPMFLPDAYAHGTAFLCRNPDPSWHEVGLARLRRMLAWFPGDRYLQILAEGGIANSLVDIATGEDAELCAEALWLLQNLSERDPNLLASAAVDDAVQRRLREGRVPVQPEVLDGLLAIAERVRAMRQLQSESMSPA